MASLDSFLVYVKSSLDLNFAMSVSPDDDISSLKKKAEANHLALFPHMGGIVVRAFKMMQQGTEYFLPDSTPIRCLFAGVTGPCSLLMDAEVVPVNLAEACQNGMHVDLDQNNTHKGSIFFQDPVEAGGMLRGGEEDQIGGENHISSERISQDDALKDKDLSEGSLNQDIHSRCMSESLKKAFEVVEEIVEGVGVFKEYAECNTKRKKSGDPTPDEVPPSSGRKSTSAGDEVHETNAAFENENTDMHRTGNPGETSSLPASGDDPENLLLNKMRSSCPSDLKDKGRVTPGSQINDNAADSLPNPDLEIILGKIKQASQTILKTKEKRKSEEVGKHKSEKSRNNRKSATDSVTVSDKKQATEKVPSVSHLVDDPINEHGRKPLKKRAREKVPYVSHLVDDPINEHGRKRLKKAVRKSPTKKLAAKFGISESNIAVSGSNTHVKEVLIGGVGVSSLKPEGKHEINAGDDMHETNAAFETENTDMHLTGNAGETSSLAASGDDPENLLLIKMRSSRPSDLKDKGRLTPGSQMNDNAAHSLPNPGIEVNLVKTKQASQTILKTKEKHKSEEVGKHKSGKSRNNRKSMTDSVVVSDKKQQSTEEIPSVSHLVDDTINEHGRKRPKKAVQKSPTKKLAAEFDISGSNIAGSGSSTHAKEVLIGGVGVSSPESKGKQQKEMVPEELQCHRNSGSGWRCSKIALPNEKYCSQHCRK